ncbi:MAG: 30S ribosomal protein S6 [Spirulinaceae cyanobacterium]
MTSYELMYIIRPDIPEDRVEETINKYRTFLVDQGAEDIQIQNRGKRRLAYEIQNFQDGIYVQVNYKAEGTHVALMERSMRLSEEVIRYLTLRVNEPKPDPSEAEPVAAEA